MAILSSGLSTSIAASVFLSRLCTPSAHLQIWYHGILVRPCLSHKIQQFSAAASSAHSLPVLRSLLTPAQRPRAQGFAAKGSAARRSVCVHGASDTYLEQACEEVGAGSPTSSGVMGGFKKRLRIADVKGGADQGLERVGQRISIRGWVRTCRLQRAITFVEVNDGSCLSNLQCVISSDIEGYDKVESGLITTGASVFIDGVLVASQGSKQAVELRAMKLVLVLNYLQAQEAFLENATRALKEATIIPKRMLSRQLSSY